MLRKVTAPCALRYGRGGPGGWPGRAAVCLLLVLLGVTRWHPVRAAAGKEGFVVMPFANTRSIRTLDHLSYGLPAIIAERLATVAPLRFEGPSELHARTVTPSARWQVTGAFERLRDGKLTVTVQVRAAGTPEEIAASASRAGAKDDAPTLALEAAIAVFSATPGVRLPPETFALVGKAPFARDPYAFVLYGRAVAAYHARRLSAVPSKGPAPPATNSGEASSPSFTRPLVARVGKSLEALTRSLRVDPRVPETLRFSAVVYLASGQPALARSALAAALERRPEYAAALRLLAGLDRVAGLPVARQRYARLLELDPHDLEARRTYADLLSEAGLLSEAQRELERVLSAAPADLRVRRSLVLVLAARRAGKELCAELEEVVRLDPENIDARMDLGAAYLNVGRTADAAYAYDEVLRQRPRHVAALKLVADLAHERGDLERAMTTYAKLRWLAPTDPRPLFLMAAAHAEAGNVELAERLFAEAARFPGLRADALSNLGALALERGDPMQALWYLQRAVRGAPAKPGVRYNHALALHRLGRDGEALNELRAAEAADPADAGVRFLAGVVSLRLGLIDEAVSRFREAVLLDPKHKDARHNLGLLEPLAGGPERSLSFYQGDSAQLSPATTVARPKR